MSNPFALPDFVERKGSLFLRSDHMNYSRATLNSNWHQAREAEPKDYDIALEPTRNLCRATYKRIGDSTDGTLPETTYQDHSQQIFKCKKLVEPQKIGEPMVTLETYADAIIDRDTGAPKEGHEAILPGHHPGHDILHSETTHKADYTPPFPFTPFDEKAAADAQQADTVEEMNKKMANKKCLSQFCDGHRRPGWNTWEDQSGVYANTHYKRQIFQPTRTTTAAYE